MLNMRATTTTLLLMCLAVAPSQAFFGNLGKASKPASKASPFTEEAISVFDQTFPFGRAPPKSNIMGDFGMPFSDIDGTPIKKKYANNRRLTDISKQDAAATFNELAKCYGDDRAISMVKAQPICLAFDKINFSNSLAAWTDVFGLEKSQDMVCRNPGLLAVGPDEAAKSDDSTMVFSYIVAATRPLGSVLLATLLLLVLTPAIEAVTGIQYGINH